MSTNAFLPDEIVIMSHWDKQKKEYVKTQYPKVGGRLRLAHADNQTISINTEIVKFEDGLAVVKAEAETQKGTFQSVGSASVERDDRLADSLLELAETRAIARSLRFAGYGVEYCSAEEVSHLEGEREEPAQETSKPDDGDGQPASKGNDGNSNDRLTNAQRKDVHAIAKRKGLGHKALNAKSIEMFNLEIEHLSKDQAAHIINALQQ